MLGLELFLHSGEPVDPIAAAAWPASEEGKEFISMSSDRWRDANIASGADRAAARAAAERTTAFYTASDP